MHISEKQLTYFRERLMNWYETSHRPLPWKGEKNPYLIWLSEVILQQTRVEQGLPYFERFRDAYPSVHDLANASEDEIMKRWEGLGYYSRARNMHATARYIANECGGKFPDSYEAILALKGVGPYTAAAIASFAYDLPHAVLDGNVFRVLARFLGIEIPTDSTEGKALFNQLAQRALDPNQAGRYNQAIMDFGATQCTPQAPDCRKCPLQNECIAFKHSLVDKLPLKAKKLSRRERYFHYLILQTADSVLLRKRIEKDIWQNLYEFPVIELPTAVSDFEELQSSPHWQSFFGTSRYQVKRVSKPFKQTLTHQVIHAFFWEIDLPQSLPQEERHYIVTERKNLSNFAFPKIIDWYLRDNSLYLNLF